MRLVLAMLVVGDVCAARSGPPILQTMSPSDGTIINPGQAISVTVISPVNASFSKVAVIGEDLIGASEVQTSVAV